MTDTNPPRWAMEAARKIDVEIRATYISKRIPLTINEVARIIAEFCPMDEVVDAAKEFRDLVVEKPGKGYNFINDFHMEYSDNLVLSLNRLDALLAKLGAKP